MAFASRETPRSISKNKMSNKELTVLTLVTKSYVTLLHDYFLTTLPAEIEKMKILYVNDFDNCRYNSVAKFLEKKRLEMIYKEIKANMGNNLIFIDADVLFASKTKFQDEINEILENYDLAFQFNDDWYNFGVLLSAVMKEPNLYSNIFWRKKSIKFLMRQIFTTSILSTAFWGYVPLTWG